ncbi:unnamed protein product [Symbiodinium natans]|uniref:SET domain-containing protein n=1 Tax=Symbiodinium natans TaxID=878477 RepID=A0A812KZ74_9DINO|nr:unnamed protein product [Symbiodinium natans]
MSVAPTTNIPASKSHVRIYTIYTMKMSSWARFNGLRQLRSESPRISPAVENRGGAWIAVLPLTKTQLSMVMHPGSAPVIQEHVQKTPTSLEQRPGWSRTLTRKVEQMQAYSQQIKESARWVAQTADVSEERACWAIGAVISRSFAADEVRAMVPLADIFNHKPQRPAEGGSDAAWRLSEDGSRFEVRAVETAKVGEASGA